MNEHQKKMIASLEDLNKTTEILLRALNMSDGDKAHEAISVMLMQGVNFFGPQSAAMQQFFPVWDTIRSQIESADFSRAIGQTMAWRTQLHEVISIVKQG